MAVISVFLFLFFVSKLAIFFTADLSQQISANRPKGQVPSPSGTDISCTSRYSIICMSKPELKCYFTLLFTPFVSFCHGTGKLKISFVVYF